jgi:hypothetical protein
MSRHAYEMPGAGPVVPGTRAYRWSAVKHSSYFLRCGTDTDMSLTSRRTCSAATSVAVLVEEASLPPSADGAAAGRGDVDVVVPPSRRRRFEDGSSASAGMRSATNVAISLKSVMRAGVSAACAMPARMSGREEKTASSARESSAGAMVGVGGRGEEIAAGCMCV